MSPSKSKRQQSKTVANKERRKPVKSFSLSPYCLDVLAECKEVYGIPESAIMEMLIRQAVGPNGQIRIDMRVSAQERT